MKKGRLLGELSSHRDLPYGVKLGTVVGEARASCSECEPHRQRRLPPARALGALSKDPEAKSPMAMIGVVYTRASPPGNDRLVTVLKSRSGSSPETAPQGCGRQHWLLRWPITPPH